jgi:hypothetical protein
MEELPDSLARNELLANLKKMRADAAAAQTLQARAHESAVRAFCDGVKRLSRRLDALELKHADARRLDAEESSG